MLIGLSSFVPLQPRQVATTPHLESSKGADGRKVVNGYAKVQRLGQGSYGKVVLYRHVERGEHFAIKVVSRSALARKNVGSGSTALANQLREIEILKQLEHPNIVRLEEVIDDPGEDRIYIVEQWLEQGPVMEEDAPPLPQAEARDVLLHVCAGLAYLHEQGVVHGDVKPGNLLRGADGADTERTSYAATQRHASAAACFCCCMLLLLLLRSAQLD